MSRISFAKACALLSELSDSELEQLGSRIAALRALSSGPARSDHPPAGRAGPAASPDQNFERLLFEACSDLLAEATGERKQEWGSFLMQKRTAEAFRKAAQVAGQQHAIWFPKATRVETAALCRIYVRACLSFMDSVRRPVGWHSLIAELRSLAPVLDWCFPGYAASGVLSLLLNPRGHQEGRA